MMQRELNFTAVYYRRLDRTWGSRYDNGSFYGMVEDVHRGHVDLIGSSMTMEPDRAEGINFLHPIGIETYALFVPAIGK